jgi:MFS family permease
LWSRDFFAPIRIIPTQKKPIFTDENKNAMSARVLVFWACCAGMLLFGMSAITLGAMAQPLQERFGLDGVGAGTLFSILPIGILAGSIFFGPISDRYGFRYLLSGAAVAMGLGFDGIALTHSMPLLYGSIFLFGFGGGILNGATSAVVNDISTGNKGANLSLLGVFFGVGGLGMPMLLALLERWFAPFAILGAVGAGAILIGMLYLLVPFPGGKTAGMPLSMNLSHLFKPLLLFVSFFLFFQSGMEGLINNWSTTFLTRPGGVSEADALFGLSFYMFGMTVMRLLVGSVLRTVSRVGLMWTGLGLVALGLVAVQQSGPKELIWAGLFLAGSGLALGFPVLLGFVGEQFADASGAAFSFAFSVALVGNMLFNYSLGYLVDSFGISQYVFAVWIALLFMGVMLFFIQKQVRPHS